MKKRAKSKQNKAQSEIITTVLIILLVLAAIVIIWQVVKNTVTTGTENIENTAACLDAMDELEIDKAGSCYDPDMKVQVKVNRGLKDIEISKFAIVVTSSQSSEKFEVKNGDETFGVIMENEDNILQIPELGNTKTYKITTELSDINYLQIAPILGETTCNPLEKIEISECSGTE